MESEARHQSRESGKNQLRRGKPRVRIACVMVMLMMCCRVAAAGVVVDDEETEELPPISRRRMSCRVGAYTAFRWVAPFALSIVVPSGYLVGPAPLQSCASR